MTLSCRHNPKPQPLAYGYVESELLMLMLDHWPRPVSAFEVMDVAKQLDPRTYSRAIFRLSELRLVRLYHVTWWRLTQLGEAEALSELPAVRPVH